MTSDVPDMDGMYEHIMLAVHHLTKARYLPKTRDFWLAMMDRELDLIRYALYGPGKCCSTGSTKR